MGGDREDVDLLNSESDRAYNSYVKVFFQAMS